MSEMPEFVEVTTEAKAKRHWSLVPTAQWRRHVPLCNSTPYAMTQAEVDDGMPKYWRKRTVITDLPPCKQCDKSRQRRIDGRPS